MLQFIICIVVLLPMLAQGQHNADVQPFAESQFIDVGGVRLHYRLIQPKGECRGNVLLVHGFASSTFSWRKNWPVLVENGYRVLMVDLPAYGYSDKKTSFDHSQYNRAQLLWQLTEKIANAPWTLVGHSMGGELVMYMAAIAPEKTKRLLIVDGAFNNTKLQLGKFFARLLFQPEWMERFAEKAGRWYFFNEKRFHQLLSSAYHEDAGENAVKGYMEPFQLPNSFGAIAYSFAHAREKQVDFQHVKCPVLLIWGEEDTWVPLKYAARIQKVLPQADLRVIPGCGHHPIETHSDQFNALMLQFFKGHK